MTGNELKNYVQRLINGHENRTAPKGRADLTPTQIDIYETVNDICIATGVRIISLESVKENYFKKHGRQMQLLLSDFCYNLVNVGPDYETKFLFHRGRGNYEFVDLFADTASPVQIIWEPKGKNVPEQLAGRQFRVGQYYRGAYKWDFKKLRDFIDNSMDKKDDSFPSPSKRRSSENFNNVERLIRNKFAETKRRSVNIPLLKKVNNKNHFTAKLHQDGIGINVNNLGQNPLLVWRVFDEAVNLMKQLGGTANKGTVMKKGKSIRLGDPELGVDTIEGHVAQIVYGKQIGESVFRRITPIAGILIWAGICKAGRGKLTINLNETDLR